MRLHGGDVQRRFDLGGVVAVVGIHLHAVGDAGQFVAPVRAAEVVQRLGDRLHRQTARLRHGDGGQRVEHVGLPGHAEGKFADGPPLPEGGEAGAAVFVVAKPFRPQRVSLAQPVGDVGKAALRDDALNAHIVAPADDGLRQARELQKRRFDVVYILVAVQMVLVDVEDDRHGGVEVQKTAVVLAGLEDELIPAAPRGAAQIVQFPADVYARVAPGGQKHLRQHRGGGGLAVRAADGDGALAALHQLPNEVAALHLRYAQPRGLGALGVVRGDGGGVDDQLRAAHVFRLVADKHLHAMRFQRFGFVRAGAVRAGDLVALVLQKARQPRHGAAAHADHVYALHIAYLRHPVHLRPAGGLCSLHYRPKCAQSKVKISDMAKNPYKNDGKTARYEL